MDTVSDVSEVDQVTLEAILNKLMAKMMLDYKNKVSSLDEFGMMNGQNFV